MARPKVDEKKEPISISLKPSTLGEIERLAKKLELPRNKFIENLIEVSLDDAKIFDKLGVWSMLMTVSKAARKLRGGVLYEKISWDEDGNMKINA